MEMWLDFFFLPKEKEKTIDSEKEIIWFAEIFGLEDYSMWSQMQLLPLIFWIYYTFESTVLLCYDIL